MSFKLLTRWYCTSCSGPTRCLQTESSEGKGKGKGKEDAPTSPPPLFFNMRTPLNNGHGAKLHEDTVWAGVECLAVFILDCGSFLPATQVSLIELRLCLIFGKKQNTSTSLYRWKRVQG